MLKDNEIDNKYLNENISLVLLNSLKLNNIDMLDKIKPCIPENRFNNYLGIFFFLIYSIYSHLSTNKNETDETVYQNA